VGGARFNFCMSVKELDYEKIGGPKILQIVWKKNRGYLPSGSTCNNIDSDFGSLLNTNKNRF
jgi:hypothetical protein